MPFPTILAGIPLRLRRLAVTVDRPDFLVNPTDCDPLSITGVVTSTCGTPRTVSSPFHAVAATSSASRRSCDEVHRGQGSAPRAARIRVSSTTVTPVAGQANLATTTVIVPASITLDANNLPELCARPTRRSAPVRRASAVGSAKVTTPLVNGAAHRGRSYLVNGGRVGCPSLLGAVERADRHRRARRLGVRRRAHPTWFDADFPTPAELGSC